VAGRRVRGRAAGGLGQCSGTSRVTLRSPSARWDRDEGRLCASSRLADDIRHQSSRWANRTETESGCASAPRRPPRQWGMKRGSNPRSGARRRGSSCRSHQRDRFVDDIAFGVGDPRLIVYPDRHAGSRRQGLDPARATAWRGFCRRQSDIDPAPLSATSPSTMPDRVVRP